jgi:hypothetical protein
MTRSELQAAVAALSHRTDLAGTFATWLAMGESRINKDIRANEMIVFGQVDTSLPEVYPGAWSLPDDYLEMRDVIVPGTNGRRTLLSAGRDEIAAYSGSQRSGPAIYSIYDGAIEFRPLPQGQVVDLIYYGRLAPLVLDTDTNEVLTNFPELYIYAVLIGVFGWTQDDVMKADAMGEYGRAVTTVNEFAANQRFGTSQRQYSSRRFGYGSARRWG